MRSLEFDYTRNLIDENEKLRGLDPLRKFMEYRNDDEMIDRDRCHLAMAVYEKLEWVTDKENQEPDTFFASAYCYLRLMCKKFDKESGDNFYVTDFKRYINEDTIEKYNNLSDSKAKYYRKMWFCKQSTVNHYAFLRSEVIINYIDAAHKIGAFHIVEKGFGYQPKCKWLLDDGIRSLKVIEENWYNIKNLYNSMSFEEYKNKYILNGAYVGGRLNRTDLEINFESSWNQIFTTIENLTKFINERTVLIINELEDK